MQRETIYRSKRYLRFTVLGIQDVSVSIFRPDKRYSDYFLRFLPQHIYSNSGILAEIKQQGIRSLYFSVHYLLTITVFDFILSYCQRY
jgi:hypothetical protein